MDALKTLAWIAAALGALWMFIGTMLFVGQVFGQAAVFVLGSVIASVPVGIGLRNLWELR
jgi:hypothetical protein